MTLLKALLMLHVALGSITGASPKATPSLTPIDGCNRALNACQGVIKAQDDAIARLKANTRLLEDRLADSTRQPLLPTWALITLSVLAGATAVSLLHK